jgi:hypothetical protein
MPALPSIGCANFSNNDASTLNPAEHPACAEGHDRKASRCAKISCESSLSLTCPATASLRPWWHAKLCMIEHGWDAGCMGREERAETSEESDCSREVIRSEGRVGTGGRRRTRYPRSSSVIIVCTSVVGTDCGAPPACTQTEKKLEIKVCGHNQAQRLTVKDGSKLSELSSAASSISIYCLRRDSALVQSRTASMSVIRTYLRHCVL